MVIVDDKIYRHHAIYEHFFRVHSSNRHDNNSLRIEPVFLDQQFVLQKAFEHQFVTTVPVPVEYIENKEFLIQTYLKTADGSIESVDLDDSYASSDNVAEFIKNLNALATEESPEDSKAKTVLINRIKRKCPFKHYKNVINPLSGVGDPQAWLSQVDFPLYRFYQAVEEHRNLLSEIVFTFEQMNSIGSWNQVLQHAQELHARACQSLAPLIEISINYWINGTERLCLPVLDTSSLKSIVKPSIFRVFLPSQGLCLRPSIRLTTWGGSLLPGSLLSHLQPGNIVRICLGDQQDPDYWSKIYVTFLKRIDHSRFLAAHLNAYSVADENLLLVVDKRAILEVPMQWHGNENLNQVLPSLTPPREEEEPPEGFLDTIQRLIRPGYLNSIMDVNTVIPLNYDGLFH